MIVVKYFLTAVIDTIKSPQVGLTNAGYAAESYTDSPPNKTCVKVNELAEYVAKKKSPIESNFTEEFEVRQIKSYCLRILCSFLIDNKT